MSQWEVHVGASDNEGLIYVPAVDSLGGTVTSPSHDNPESGRFGALKTTDLLSRDCYSPAIDSHIGMYVSGGEEC